MRCGSTGADVKLVDVEPVRFGIDPDGVEAAIGPRTRALSPSTSTAAAPTMGGLEPICRAKHLALICDAAEGLGSRHAGRAIGTFGLASCFSFSANKTITAGQGGIITTDSDALHDRLRELKDQGRRHGGTGGDDLHPVMGYNFKFTDLQAAVALPQLDEIETAARGRPAARQFLCRAACQSAGADAAAIRRAGEVRQWTDVLIDNRAAVSAALDERQDRQPRLLVPAAPAGALRRGRKPLPQQHRHLAPRALAGVAVRSRRGRLRSHLFGDRRGLDGVEPRRVLTDNLRLSQDRRTK